MNKDIHKKIEDAADPVKAKNLMRFFKTGKGEYGEGDIFLGIVVPEQRKIAKEFVNIPISDVSELIDSKIHEKRLIGLLILMEKLKKSDEKEKKEIFDLYLKKVAQYKINNWDLVDLSAPRIVGNYLIDKNRDILYKLAKSSNLWEKRISIVATFAFISKKDFDDALKVAEILLNDKHDLIHKAVGWMLREVGKRDKKVLEEFLKKHCLQMPRTMLRYSIEKFPEEERKRWLKGEN